MDRNHASHDPHAAVHAHTRAARTSARRYGPVVGLLIALVGSLTSAFLAYTMGGWRGVAILYGGVVVAFLVLVALDEWRVQRSSAEWRRQLAADQADWERLEALRADRNDR